MQRGVRGVVSKDVDAATLVESLRTVAAGRYWLSPESIVELMMHVSPAAAATSRDGSQLTPRELEVVARIAAGESNRTIARTCGISEKTVKHHLTTIFDKLGVSSRLELAVYALEHHLVTARTPDTTFVP